MAEKILRTEYSEEMQRSYMNYSMSVITARAIPDARDGLKPVQRRVLYDMRELHLDHDKPHRKSARIVGDTMGKYHPHGDSSIYETLVVMSQNFKKGMALVDGHGNFGSIEGDGAAAMRYTEARLEKFAEEVYLKDLDKTVNFVPNYDETEKEPEVLPVRVPNLLINGAEGIAVGMSTSIPPHNLGEVVDVVQAYIDNPEVTTQELMELMPGPDFPTGGVIANKSELPQVYETGMGKIKLRGKFEVELGKRKADKDKLIISEIPYTMIGAGINKFLVDVADLVESKKLTDVVDISNQSNKEGIRIVLELRKDADIDKIKNILYKKTKLEDTFGVNMLAIADGRPETLNLKGILRNFLNFQYENTERKYNVLLQKEMDKKEVQEGLIAACDCIDLIIAILRGSKNLKDAKACLTTGDVTNIHFKVPGFEEDAKKLAFTERQASAILEMRLYKLIGLEILALEKEHRETLRKIAEYKKILGSRPQMNRVIKEDLAAIKAEFATPRRTLIEDGPEAVYDESAVAVQEMVFVMDRFGYCKLLDKSTYDRNQETVDNEQVHVVKCLNTDKICLFAASGSLYQIKAMDVPAGKLRDKGAPIENLSKFDGTKDTIVYLTSAENMKGRIFVFATKMAMVKQVPAAEFETNNRVVAATKLQDGDELAAVIPVEGQTEVVIQTTGGVFLRFALEEISMLKKASRGVRGIRLSKNEELEKLYLIGENPIVDYKGKEVHLNRLKLAKRDGKGSKVRL
ncbi:DNA gyrase/topoisomerase IV subunit A [Enterocloster clostridioformis]|uniref:DNA topoisomerase (ATP-hydrolyzing) n=1 Tax=Enterocloster clostridioformis TaxID=1531 RepID=A0A2X2UWX9_9FIRM|nr:DNA topoisomerase (ATP-hydrolyzing) [Enterocloster clostridioformis]MCA5576209.1 DNA topoisomerase 4 subunit A [Enterocloster clostridioformis]SQB16295.1 DNA topoisomerase [Enterocloster clostridioformis]